MAWVTDIKERWEKDTGRKVKNEWPYKRKYEVSPRRLAAFSKWLIQEQQRLIKEGHLQEAED